ncbi:MAG: MBL fold metallo-hydrolase [Actinomycetota bacterium]
MLRVLRILAPNPGAYTLEGTNTWIVGEDPAVVIDPGPDDLPGHLEEVARAAGPIGVVLVTHDHPDHAPGAAAFAAMVGASLYAFRLPGSEHLRDGQVLRAGALSLTAVHTPGHTSDHVVFFEPTTRALFSGDAVLGRGRASSTRRTAIWPVTCGRSAGCRSSGRGRSTRGTGRSCWTLPRSSGSTPSTARNVRRRS